MRELPQDGSGRVGEAAGQQTDAGGFCRYLPLRSAQTQPFYVLVDNEGNPLTRSYSYDEDVDKFVQFLETGLKAYHK